MRLSVVAILAALLSPAPSLAESEVDPNIDRAPTDTLVNRGNLIGRWYLTQPTNRGGVWRVLSTLNPDGTYSMKFEEHLDGEFIQKYREEGLWGVSGNILFTITQRGYVDGELIVLPPERPDNYLAYEIIELSESQFVYDSVVSDNRFRSRKVPSDFEMPPLR